MPRNRSQCLGGGSTESCKFIIYAILNYYAKF
jgi:hypothetical protein